MASARGSVSDLPEYSGEKLSVPDFYDGCGVFITGATGFVGKVVLEKVLRSCPGVKLVYMLARPKKGVSPQERLDTMLQGDLFLRLRREQPDFSSKIRLVKGELTEENMGIDEDELAEMREHVNIVLHIAATVRFNEPLKIAVNLNMVGVHRVLTFCNSCRHIKAMVHTSTAFSQTDKERCEEKNYPTNFRPKELMQMMDIMDDKLANTITKKLIEGRPNTYTYTKSLAEAMVKETHGDVPVAIVRPSIVSSTWREPYPGWTDNLNGVSGLALAVGTGVLRAFPGKRACKGEIVPVDIVANYIIGAAAYVGVEARKPEPTIEMPFVLNCTTSEHAAEWGVWIDAVIHGWMKYPLEKHTFRRPFVSLYEDSSWQLYIVQTFQQKLVGRLFDLLARLQGAKPVLSRAYSRIETTSQDYVYFTSNSWIWDDANRYKVMSTFTDADKVSFNLDMRPLHWRSYIDSQIIGLKKFVMREDMDRISLARRNQKKLALWSWLLRSTVLAFCLKVLVPYLQSRGLLKSKWMFMIPALVITSRF